jgi:predicted N-acyltransferase
MLTVKKYKSIHETDPQHWDSILVTDDNFHTYSFISIVEDSKVEDADFFYLLFYDNEQLVATTVLSAFNIYLDLFINDNWLVRKLKKIFPNLFKVKILVCGLPASFGQLNFKVVNEKYADEVCSLIVKEMYLLAKKLRISLLTVKELMEEDKNRFNRFEKEGFFLANSIPYMHLDVQWSGFNEYLFSLRHHYRRRILLSLKKINYAEPVIVSSSEYDNESETPAWVLAEPDEKFSDEFYKMYLGVMERTATRLETLNRDFFKNLFLQQEAYKLLNLVVKGRIISSAVLIFKDDTITFMLAGRENDRDEYDSYFNLVYGIIALAIQSGCKKIKLGQTAYWVKQCVGALPKQELFYFASRRPVMHWILKSLRNVIFPVLKLKPVNIFRKPGKVNESPVKYEQCHLS